MTSNGPILMSETSPYCIIYKVSWLPFYISLLLNRRNVQSKNSQVAPELTWATPSSCSRTIFLSMIFLVELR